MNSKMCVNRFNKFSLSLKIKSLISHTQDHDFHQLFESIIFQMIEFKIEWIVFGLELVEFIPNLHK